MVRFFMKPVHLPGVIACVAALLVSSAKADDDITEITITAHKSELLFDIKEFTVKAGRKVKVTLVNPADSLNLQPHNLLIIEPGTMEEVGMAANAGLADPDFLSERNAVPTSNYVLYHTKLLQPGESETIEFTAPDFADDYPFLCTYPGHWSVMHGLMIVED
jgi:azurin